MVQYNYAPSLIIPAVTVTSDSGIMKGGADPIFPLPCALASTCKKNCSEAKFSLGIPISLELSEAR